MPRVGSNVRVNEIQPDMRIDQLAFDHANERHGNE
jgi:hypothetical protein